MREAASEWARRSWKVFPGGSLGEYNLPRELSVVLTRGQGDLFALGETWGPIPVIFPAHRPFESL